MNKHVVLTAGSLLVIVAGCGKVLYGEATTYAPGFSEDRFKQVHTGMTVNDVLALVGKPLLVVTQEWQEMWIYPHRFEPPALERSSNESVGYDPLDPPFVTFSLTGRVETVSTSYLSQDLIGLSKQELLATIGAPDWKRITEFAIIFHYSGADRVKGNGTYRKKTVRFDSGERVKSVDSSMYYD